MRGKRTDKRKYYALMLGVLMVVLLVGGTMLQSTYELEGGWSLEMSINDMLLNSEAVSYEDAITVVGDAENGYDYVLISADEIGPDDPFNTSIQRTDTGAPAIGISLGSFTQPVSEIDTSTPGTKICTWSFAGKIVVQTFAAKMPVDEYTMTSDGVNKVPAVEVAELNVIKLGVDIDFNIIGGDDAIGTCVISEIIVTSTQDMVDFTGTLAGYAHPDTSSLKIDAINDLNAAYTKQSDSYAEVKITGNIAAAAEIFEEKMTVFNAVSTYEVSFEVVQVVGELDNARFSVPDYVNFLPTSADAIFADPGYLGIIALVVGLIIVGLFAVSYVYGKPKPMP